MSRRRNSFRFIATMASAVFFFRSFMSLQWSEKLYMLERRWIVPSYGCEEKIRYSQFTMVTVGNPVQALRVIDGENQDGGGRL
jgi:hypothetical protein